MGLHEVVRAFRAKGSLAVQAASGGSDAPLWVAACDLVDAILQGVHAHLPAVALTCEVCGQCEKTGHTVACEAEEAVTLTVSFDGKHIVGEVATPTRFCHEIHIVGKLRFALERPSGDSAKPLVLRVAGLELPELPDVTRLREHMKAALGHEYGPDAALRWWMQNKHEQFPLEKSKFHRIAESLWGQRATMMLPRQFVTEFIWGFLNGTNCHLEAFMFQHGSGASPVKITARRGPGQTDLERELLAISGPLAIKQLLNNRASGEKFAASMMNFVAMIYGQDARQPGANARLITKVFSAASWWGPGQSGWQQYDTTWCCRDQKNSFGMVVKEQGRVIWRVAGEPTPPDVAGKYLAPTKAADATFDHHVSLRSLLCCRRRPSTECGRCRSLRCDVRRRRAEAQVGLL